MSADEGVMNIVLIGFMGTGKSAVGRLLAAELRFHYLDTDQLIEKAEGRKIAEIFKTDGEPYFRRLETETLQALQDYDNFVISTGGGMVLKEDNIALLKAIGPVVLLKAGPKTIYDRIKSEKHRPLLAVPDPLAEIKKILAYRGPFYDRAADRAVDSSDLTPEAVAKEIITWLRSRSS
ncbi:MAG: shikimate kinase [Candidatus Saganbacteria bacterium]|nr:shikimate kinase [Candidatus Saganbacteria bacterium]